MAQAAVTAIAVATEATHLAYAGMQTMAAASGVVQRQKQFQTAVMLWHSNRWGEFRDRFERYMLKKDFAKLSPLPLQQLTSAGKSLQGFST